MLANVLERRYVVLSTSLKIADVQAPAIVINSD
jgi:hypothetical protein